MSAITDYGLIADIGGTHARFALVDALGNIGEPTVRMTRNYPSFAGALLHYLKDLADDKRITAAAICGAGPVLDGAIQLTNCPWHIERSLIEAACKVHEPVLINDFTAIAHALPLLAPAFLTLLGGGPPAPGAPMGVIGPGTGLGVSGLIPAGEGKYAALAGEGGHVGLAPASIREIAIYTRLMMPRGHVPAETVLSGPGLELLYATIAAIDGAQVETALSAADIIRAARDGGNATAQEAIQLFTGWLGAVAGDLALTLGARGGIYIAGGMVPRLGGLFNAVAFRHRFEAKGPYKSYLAAIPAWLITHEYPGLVGLASLLR